MESNKQEKLEQLFREMSNCKNCCHLVKKNGKDCSLINIYQEPEFYQNIPSIWTDWYRRVDADIMIIGQDWGPYEEMKKFHDQYLLDKTPNHWNYLIEEEKSMTKKMLTKYLMESSKGTNHEMKESDMNHIYVTNAIMCARKGNHYRGDNIQLKESTIGCSRFLKRQIEIVNPKIIVTLGYYPLLSLSHIFHFKIEDNLTKTIEKMPEIQVQNYRIIPLYHPTAQVNKERQIAQYERIWKS